ncbi:flavocytochrome c [Sphaerisporangium siamense]|uniref:Succinate dehydrogenase/fumarate reductase flavoprotein subunit n=1 Tax=Sphaerisporangium siamense TaxID=795645 RepID=A0A7W7DD06_9ACTN|nr:FAD-dependent oxidoreductase [Sphaerisporangium siamense]MBB4704537.1 succinate dehydrogenase/fumarate reductase flavoprotein subunit [Sphaerisporangium siamense]GII86149.1 flavocytochrome c [Sphaerisporangium siamense]
MELTYDLVVVGAGTAGIPCAAEAALGGARVLLVEKDHQIGGTLHVSGGHMAAAGTRRQAERGIADSVEAHLADIRRISAGTAREDLVRITAENAAETVDWLDGRGFRFASETPRIIYGHEPYGTPRTYYGVDEAMSILEVYEGLLEEALATGRLELWKNSPVIGLIPREDGDGVAGVTVLRGSGDVDVRAGHVVLATGGFAADPELFLELEGAPLVSAAHPTSTGDGIIMARELGAAVTGTGSYLPTFGGLPHPTSPGKANWSDRQLLITAERPPVEIYVDKHGNRWVAEDEPSIDEKERALTRIDDMTFWTVFDDAMLESTRSGRPLVVGWSPEDLRARAGHRTGVHVAATLEELAAEAGIDPAGLAATAARYNEAVASGADPDFGRAHLPLPLTRPPFYAIRNHAISLVTFAGADIDAGFRVRRADGSSIPNLYAIGEIIGAAATCGQSFCSGMLVTPAITFGRLLGRRLASRQH